MCYNLDTVGMRVKTNAPLKVRREFLFRELNITNTHIEAV